MITEREVHPEFPVAFSALPEIDLSNAESIRKITERMQTPENQDVVVSERFIPRLPGDP